MPEAKEKWAAALAEVTMPRGAQPVGGQQVDTPVADIQRAYQALDLDRRRRGCLRALDACGRGRESSEAGKRTVTATFSPTPVTADVGRRPFAGDRQAYGERSLVAFSLSRIFSRPRSFSVLTLRRGISSASSASPATAEMLSSRSRC